MTVEERLTRLEEQMQDLADEIAAQLWLPAGENRAEWDPDGKTWLIVAKEKAEA